MIVDRIGVYLDQGTGPVAVLKEPPYRWKLDTRNLPDGEHTLRVVTHFRGGGQEIRVIPLTANNYPDVLVLGVDAGGAVAALPKVWDVLGPMPEVARSGRSAIGDGAVLVLEGMLVELVP